MGYFQFNGRPCIDPYSLARELSQSPLDNSMSEWYGKANSFVHRRGVDPSEGYLLVPSEAVRNPDNSELLIGFDGMPKTKPDGRAFTPQQLRDTQALYQKAFQLSIDWARKASPAAYETMGYSLVKVHDARYHLAEELVGKRFNYPIGYQPAGLADLYGKYLYHPETQKQEQTKSGDILYRPYTWEELFQECFVVPSGLPLNTLRITYPTYTPQDLDWRYVTRRNALEMLCQWCNVSIEWDGINQYHLIEVKPGDTQIGSLEDILFDVNQYTTLNAFPKKIETPGKLKLHFPYLNPKSQHTSIYRTVDSDSYPDGGNETLSLRLPCYAIEGDIPAPTQNPEEVAKKFFALTKKYYEQFPPQEKTLSGLRYQPSGGSVASPLNPNLRIKPSSYLEQVTWYDTGAGPRTLITSIVARPWLIRPKPTLQRGLVAAIGRVVGNVQETTTQFKVKQLRLINPTGALPSGVEGETEDFILSRNTFSKAYVDGNKILVFGEDYAQLWDTDDSGGTSGSDVIEFSLLEDKSAQDFARRAVGIGENRLPLPSQDENGDPINQFYVVDPQQRFQGYKAYDDPLYGQQKSYRGTALKFTDEYGVNPVLPGYVIIEMEHAARFLEARTPTLAETGGGGLTNVAIPGSDYWDGRPPKTQEFPGSPGGGGTGVVGLVFIDRQSLFGVQPPGAKIKLIWDEQIQGYTLWVVRPKSGGANVVHGTLVQDLRSIDSTVRIKVTDFAGTPPVDDNGEMTVFNVPDLLYEKLSSGEGDRYVFVGNIDGYCQATLYEGDRWVLDVVQKPTSIPTRD